VSGTLNVLCCQIDIAWEDKPANFARVGAMLDSGAVSEGDLVVLPEMFATGFSMDAAALAEGPGGPTERFLAELARRRRCWVVAGLAAQARSTAVPAVCTTGVSSVDLPGNDNAHGQDGGGTHGQALGAPYGDARATAAAAPLPRATNDAVALNPAGQLVGRYSKMHLFSPAQEHLHYQAGREVCLLDLGPFRSSLLICYDLRFPELARQAVRQGAELLVFLANWPLVREAHWLALLRARAIENQAYVIGVNRCGASPHDAYGGRSLVIDPRGGVLAEAGAGPQVLRAALDAQALREYRDTFPALKDIRLP